MKVRTTNKTIPVSYLYIFTEGTGHDPAQDLMS